MCKYLQLLSISRGCQAAGRVGVKESPRGGEAPVLSLSQLTPNGARHDIKHLYIFSMVLPTLTYP